MAELMASERYEVKRLGSLINWTAFLSFDLIVLGALVRTTDSGLACPDWPLCYGKLIPTMNMQIFLEWFHRLSALILGFLLLKVAFLVFKSPTIKKIFSKQIIAAGTLFLIQCVLGGLTVLHLLDPKIVSSHLINAILFLGVLLWTAIKARAIVNAASGKAKTYKVPRFVKPLVGTFATVILVQLLLGGMVSTNHAGVICPDFPKCYGQWFPPSSFLVNLQVYHRFLGYIVLLMGIVFSLSLARYRLPPIGQLAKSSIPALIAIQILLGIVNILLVLPPWAVVAHLGNAVLIFVIVFSAYVELIMTSESFIKTFNININKSVCSQTTQGEEAHHAHN